jgi:UDP-N-acetylmuramate dehydrogenase
MAQLSAEPNIQPPLFILPDEPLHTKNWFCTGGPAKYYCTPTDAQMLSDAYRFAQAHQLDTFVLGSGANILISDEGFDGLVIKPELNQISIVEESATHALVQAGAGATMEELITFCLEHNLIGLEEFSGIPGTIGGSVYINLHYFEHLLSHFLHHATVLTKKNHEVLTVDNNWFDFGYNYSALHHGKHFLVDATFKVTKASALETSHAQGRHAEIIRHRSKRYPQSYTCGSFFRNFKPDEVTLVNQGKKVIWIAYYLDRLGLKGTVQSGGASISHQHANMIVNDGTATSADIIAVAHQMQKKVRTAFGIVPQPECRLVGFSTYPLLT